MNHNHQCPFMADELVGLVRGELESDRMQEVLSHLDTCVTCARKVEAIVALTANRDAVLEVLRGREAAEAAGRPSIRWGCIAIVAGYLVVLAVAAYYAIQWLM